MRADGVEMLNGRRMSSTCEQCDCYTARTAITMSDERSPGNERDEHRDANRDEDGAGDDIYYVHFEKHDDNGKRMQRWRQ